MSSNEITSNVPVSKLWGGNFKSQEELSLAVMTALTFALGEGKYSVEIRHSSYVIQTFRKVDLEFDARDRSKVKVIYLRGT